MCNFPFATLVGRGDYSGQHAMCSEAAVPAAPINFAREAIAISFYKRLSDGIYGGKDSK
jgi:hypothetical protein